MPIGGFAHNAETLFSEALKAVRRTAGLESASTNDLRTGTGDNLGSTLDLVFIFDAAWAGHGDHVRATDFDRAE
jgi:hypothetical protein